MNTNIINEENTTMNTTTKANKSNYSGNKGKRVICLETGEVFNTATEAAKEIGVHLSTISCVCTGKCKTAKGKTFRYIDEHDNILCIPEPPVVEKEIVLQKHAIIKGKGRYHNGNTNAVLCISTGEVYTSCTDAAMNNDTTVGSMSSVCRGRSYTTKGKKFCYVKDINEHLDEVAESIRKSVMYDEFMTKKEKHRQLVDALGEAENKVSCIEYDIQRLHEQLKQAHLEVKMAKNNLMHFEW